MTYRVRLTKLLNRWVEVDAPSAEEAEGLAFDRTVSDPSAEWRDDQDIQVESDTAVLMNGVWENAYDYKERND